MIRAQINLSKEEHAAAKREAAKLGIPVGEFLRRCLKSALPAKESKPWMRYAGMIESDDPESSLHIDEVIHGEKP